MKCRTWVVMAVIVAVPGYSRHSSRYSSDIRTGSGVLPSNRLSRKVRYALNRRKANFCTKDSRAKSLQPSCHPLASPHDSKAHVPKCPHCHCWLQVRYILPALEFAWAFWQLQDQPIQRVGDEHSRVVREVLSTTCRLLRGGSQRLVSERQGCKGESWWILGPQGSVTLMILLNELALHAEMFVLDGARAYLFNYRPVLLSE